MFEVRIHGYGGHGVLVIADLLAVACFSQGRFARVSPSLGSEHAGPPWAGPSWDRHARASASFGSEQADEPTTAFCEIDDVPIGRHEPVLHPDGLIVQSAALLDRADVLEGMKADGHVLVNSSREADELGLGKLAARHGLPSVRMLTVPASEIARRTLGYPLPNTALLGAFAALTGAVTLGGVETAILESFPGQVGRDNVEAARAGYSFVSYSLDRQRDLAHQ
jgi:pyruvate ferredoxin oxidoreductase gamma subunit